MLSIMRVVILKLRLSKQLSRTSMVRGFAGIYSGGGGAINPAALPAVKRAGAPSSVKVPSTGRCM